MKVLLYAPEYRPNFSNMIRTAEFYGLKEIFVFDLNGLMNPPNNKVSRADMNHMARVWTAGAIEFINIKVVEDVENFVKSYSGRVIATAITNTATSIDDFSFEEDDLLVMGPEKEGLPSSIISLCDHAVVIPHQGHTDCLNVSVSFGIFMNEMHKQLRILQND